MPLGFSMKRPSKQRGRVIEKCYKALSFIMTGKRFTVSDLADHLSCGWPAANNHLNAVSPYFPIAEIEERGRRWDGTITAAVYQYIKDDES